MFHEVNKLTMQMWKREAGKFLNFPVVQEEWSVELIVKQFKIIQSNFKSRGKKGNCRSFKLWDSPSLSADKVYFEIRLIAESRVEVEWEIWKSSSLIHALKSRLMTSASALNLFMKLKDFLDETKIIVVVKHLSLQRSMNLFLQ